VACDTRQHAGADLVLIVEREDEVGPPFAGQGAMGARFTLQVPPYPVESREYASGLRGGPVTHAAWKVIVKASAGASLCSRRSASTRRARA
jgi:hypothetical protein